MAGRGTDILLGGNPEYLAKQDLDEKGITIENSKNYEEQKETALNRAREITEVEHAKVVELGGLHVIGTERHESRRIDNQLRGRAARQGDPGSTRFFLSLQDDLMRIFGGDKIINLMNMMNVEDNMAIENPLITRQIQSAQKKVETYHFDARKSVLEYDDVVNVQREKFYVQRREVLMDESVNDHILYMIEREVDKILSQYISPDMSPAEYVPSEIKLMVNELHSVFPFMRDISADYIKDKRFQELSKNLQERALDGYKEHELSLINNFNTLVQRYGHESEMQIAFSDDNILRTIEKDVLLSVIDTKWTEHLNSIDMLKDSIGLVAYGQKDPLIEYKKEAFNLFNSMMSEIQSETVRHIIRARFGVQIVNNNLGDSVNIPLIDD